MHRWWSIALVALAGCGSSSAPVPATVEQLGAALFQDPNLSSPAGQACTDCHDPGFAFADPEGDRTSVGVVQGRVGPRNAPSIFYATTIPPLHLDAQRQPVGGQQWDGRAKDFAEQAALPLLNPLEMNNPDKATVVASVRASSYAPAFRKLFGKDALDDVDRAFGHITAALAAFQSAPDFAPYASKYDRYLAGAAQLSEAEQRGLEIFEDPARGNCASCHPSRPSSDGKPPMFTTHGYANLGLPKFTNSNYYHLPPDLNPDGAAYIDRGVGTTLGDATHDGKFRIPTLRNVERTPPYGHNGYFIRLDEMVDFHATRDRGSRIPYCKRATRDAPCAWPAPEIPATIDKRVGDLPLTAQDLRDLVAFLGTLSDEP